MFANGLWENVKLTMVNDLTADGTSQVDSSSVDMAGFDGVIFFGKYATANANNKMHVATSTDDSSFADLLGTAVSPGDNADTAAIEIIRPLERYLRAEAVRGTSTVLGEIWALQYRSRKSPTTQGTTIDSEIHVSPARGTA